MRTSAYLFRGHISTHRRELHGATVSTLEEERLKCRLPVLGGDGLAPPRRERGTSSTALIRLDLRSPELLLPRGRLEKHQSVQKSSAIVTEMSLRVPFFYSTVLN